MAYAGHQFGYFTMLGVGRAVLPGELFSNELIDDFLRWLDISKADYTNTFIALMDERAVEDNIYQSGDFVKLKNRLYETGLNKELMKQSNPYFILKNYLAEEEIDEYRENKSLEKINILLDILKKPYEDHLKYKVFQQPLKQIMIRGIRLSVIHNYSAE